MENDAFISPFLSYLNIWEWKIKIFIIIITIGVMRGYCRCYAWQLQVLCVATVGVMLGYYRCYAWLL